MAMPEDIKKAFIRLRGQDGRWWVDPQLRPKLVEEAREKNTSMTEVVVMIFCNFLKIQHVPSGRRADPKPDEELLNLRIPRHVWKALDAERAKQGVDSPYDFARTVLCKHYKLESYPARGVAEPAPA